MEHTNELPLREYWSFLHKITFRFLFVFILLMTSIWEQIPFIGRFFYSIHYTASFWVQNNILHNRWALYHQPTGSGDTIDDWVLFFTWLAVACIVTIIWSVIDKKRYQYSTLEDGLKIVVRLYLAMIMLGYGLSKIFVQQMPPPMLTQLYTPLGNLSPMRLSWLFIGYSAPYEIFTGLMETTAAILLLFKRTSLIGVFLAMCIMVNVAMMNFCYDIPVKLFSCFLLFLSLYLILFDMKRIFQVIILHKSVNPPPLTHVKPSWQRFGWAALVLYIVFVDGLFPHLRHSEVASRYESHHPKYYGSYDVLEYTYADSTYNSATSEDRWNQIVIGEGSPKEGYFGYIRKGLHKIEYCTYSINTDEGIWITFSKNYQGNFFKTIQKDSSIFEMTMTNGPLITKMLVKKNDAVFLLTKKPFHWISATAY